MKRRGGFGAGKEIGMAKKAKKPTTGQRMADEMLVVQDMTKNRKLTEAACDIVQMIWSNP